MRMPRMLAAAAALMLALVTAVPAWARDDRRDRRRGTVEGVVVAIDAGRSSFLLWENRRRDDRLWVVELRWNARLTVDRRGGDDDDDEDEDRDRAWPAFRGLRVGDVVWVEGRVVDNGHLVARRVTIVGHDRDRSAPIIVVPGPRPVPLPPVRGYPLRPEIFFPRNGATIDGREFTIVGRTFPGARVRIDVEAEFGFFRLAGVTAMVTADRDGVFAHTVRTLASLRGATYRVTVTSRVRGWDSPPTTIWVRQR